MIELASFISAIVGLITLILQKTHSKEAIKRREARKRDEEIVTGDDIGVSIRLSELYDKLRLHNRKKKKRSDSP